MRGDHGRWSFSSVNLVRSAVRGLEWRKRACAKPGSIGRDDRAARSHGDATVAWPKGGTPVSAGSTIPLRECCPTGRRAPDDKPEGRMGSGFDDQSRDSSRSGRSPSRRELLDVRARKRELLDEQRSGWAEGRPARPEEFLGRWPTDPDSDPDAASLLLEDYLQRRRRGEDRQACRITSDASPSRARRSKGSLARETVFRSMGGHERRPGFSLRLPDVGDEVFGFRLCLALGQGAFARVFLAEQADLAGRPVVLKVSRHRRDRAADARPVAAHQHRPDLFAPRGSARGPACRLHALPGRGEPLRGPGEALDRFAAAGLRRAVRASPWRRSRRRGPTSSASAADDESRRVPRGVAAVRRIRRAKRATPLAALRAMSYERAAAWIVAQLAEGLHHAHQRGILHRDIKPSNILISAEGQPLLLDFNLAQDGDEDAAHATIGGTVAYMAPEHLRALVGRTPALIRQVDRRSDIYSLGMVLAEMLTGHRPFEQSGSYSALPLQIEAMAVERSKAVPSVRRERPDISWGLESIARKCLAPDPARRYQQADHLADDLRRLLDDRPLKHAPELSRVERARKFARRHPRLTSSGTVAGVGGARPAGGRLGAGGVRSPTRRRAGARPVRDHDAGMLRRRSAWSTRGWTCRTTCARGSRPASRRSPSSARPRIRDWDRHPAWLRLGPEERRRLAEDRRELLLLLADARVRLAGGIERIRRAGPAPARSGRVDPRPAPVARSLARPGRATGRCGARRSGPSRPAGAPSRSPPRPRGITTCSPPRWPARVGRSGLRAAIAELDEALRAEPAPLLVAGPAGDLPPGAGRARRGRGRLRPVHRHLAGIRLGLLQSRLRARPGRQQGRGRPRLHRRPRARSRPRAGLRQPRAGPAGAEAVCRGAGRLRPGVAPWARADAIVSAGRGVALEGLGRHDEADAAFADVLRAGRRPAGLGPRAAGLGLRVRHLRPRSRPGPRGLRRCPAARPAQRPGPLRPRHARHGPEAKNAEALRRFRPGARGRPRRASRPAATAPSCWPAGATGTRRPARSTGAWSASPGRRRRSTRPPASSPGRSATSARRRPPTRRSTSSSGPWPKERTLSGPTRTPTSPRSAGSPGSVAWQAGAGARNQPPRTVPR